MMTNTCLSQPGLGGVPAVLHHLCEEVGLAGMGWESLRAEWQALTTLWLHTETTLSKSSHIDLSFTEICKASIPNEWKVWMNAKVMKIDAKHLVESFRQVLTNYLNGLPSTVFNIGNTVMM